MSLHVGDIGVVLRMSLLDGEAALNVSTATTKEIILRDPSGAKTTRDAVFTSTGVDGKIQFKTDADDLGSPGVWKMQARVVLPGSPATDIKSDVVSFPVEANL